MFAEGPPPEIVNLLDVFIGALEERHVLPHPVPGRGVGDVLNVEFPVVLVERLGVVRE